MNPIYNSNNRAEKKVNEYLNAGIHENVQLVGARYDVSTNGNEFIEFKFEKDGRKGIHTEYVPRFNQEYADTFADKCKNQFNRIRDILLCFYADEQIVFAGDSFKSLADWTIDLINKADLSKLLRVKFVYNKSGYLTLPNYTTFPFIEPMTVIDSSIQKLGMDVFEKPVITVTPDTEVKQNNPFDVVNGTVQNVNPNTDLPF